MLKCAVDKCRKSYCRIFNCFAEIPASPAPNQQNLAQS